MTSMEDAKEKIKKIFFQVFPTLSDDDFSWDKHQKDYEGWDSFAQLQLITMTEEIFKINIGLEDTIKITSAQNLLDCVKSLV